VSIFSRNIFARYFNKKTIRDENLKIELSELEKKILEGISIGKSYPKIAEELEMTKEQVQKTIRIIYEKLQQKKQTAK
jgi:DNA-binding NarL/FixJ family response regulator